MLKFFTTFGKNKVKEAATGLTQALVKFDPETATETQIDEMCSHLDKVSEQYAKARVSYEKEQKEADVIVELYEKRLKACETLNVKLEAETDEDKKQEIEKALNELLQMCEEMASDVETEKQEAVEAKEFMDELEEAVKQASNNLKTARKHLEKASKDMKLAKLREARAKEREDQIKVSSGIKKHADSLNIALNAMTQEAEKSKAKAEASNLKSRLLKKTTLEDNKLISDAMNEVSGNSTSTMSVADRLSALKKK